LKQPEAYLKSTLEMVAQLVRSGPQAMTWQLKPEYRLPTYEGARDASAPAGQDDLVDSDDEDMKMEDVVL
jgi:transcription initiation factor TFIIF subunit beta